MINGSEIRLFHENSAYHLIVNWTVIIHLCCYKFLLKRIKYLFQTLLFDHTLKQFLSMKKTKVLLYTSFAVLIAGLMSCGNEGTPSMSASNAKAAFGSVNQDLATNING